MAVAANWKTILINSSTMTELGQLRGAKDRKLDVTLNKPGSYSFSVSIDDANMAGIEPIRHGVKLMRNNVCVWSGFIMRLTDNVPTDNIDIQCSGWLEILHHRVLRVKVPYVAQARGVIIHSLLGTANLQQATWLTPGTQGDAATAITKTFEKDQNIGQAMEEMCNIEAGPMMFINPDTRSMDIKQWNQYTDRTNVQFGYQWGPNNVESVSHQHDATDMVNKITVYGKNTALAAGAAEDTGSQALYQLFESTASLSDVVNVDILVAYAGIEIIIKAIPRQTYVITPREAADNVPSFYADFDLGDKIYVKVKRLPRINVDQPMRVFAISLSLSDEGGEKLDSLKVTPE